VKLKKTPQRQAIVEKKEPVYEAPASQAMLKPSSPKKGRGLVPTLQRMGSSRDSHRSCPRLLSTQGVR